VEEFLVASLPREVSRLAATEGVLIASLPEGGGPLAVEGVFASLSFLLRFAFLP